MKTEKKIIKLFIEEKKAKTIREIAKKIKSDYKITHIAARKLLKKNIFLSTIVGKSILCELNQTYYGVEIYEAENERKEELLKKRNIKQLYKEVMEKTKSIFFIFLVFGSYVKKEQTKSSDLDIIFISEDVDFEEKIQETFSLLPIKTHILVFTAEEFIRMKDSKKSNVVQEAMKNSIILYGIEDYYRLKNA